MVNSCFSALFFLSSDLSYLTCENFDVVAGGALFPVFGQYIWDDATHSTGKNYSIYLDRDHSDTRQDGI